MPGAGRLQMPMLSHTTTLPPAPAAATTASQLLVHLHWHQRSMAALETALQSIPEVTEPWNPRVPGSGKPRVMEPCEPHSSLILRWCWDTAFLRMFSTWLISPGYFQSIACLFSILMWDVSHIKPILSFPLLSSLSLSFLPKFSTQTTRN